MSNSSSETEYAREKWRYRLQWWSFGISALTLLAGMVYGTIAYMQWDTAHGQLKLLIQERRAWVTPLIVGEYAFEGDKEVKLSVLLRNVGRIIAHSVVTETTAAVYPWPVNGLPKTLHTDQPPNPFRRGKSENGLIVPGDGVLLYAFTGLGQDVLPRVLSGTNALVVYGVVTYTDEASTKGTTGFCRVYAPRVKTFDTCPNVADWAR